MTGFNRRNIKKDIDNGEQPLSIDDATAMIAGQIASMDEETADLFQQLTKKMVEQAGG